MKYSFHAELEVKDWLTVGGQTSYSSPIYDLDLYYDFDNKLSRYKWNTSPFPFYASMYGNTRLGFLKFIKVHLSLSLFENFMNPIQFGNN